MELKREGKTQEHIAGDTHQAPFSVKVSHFAAYMRKMVSEESSVGFLSLYRNCLYLKVGKEKSMSPPSLLPSPPVSQCPVVGWLLRSRCV